MKRYIIYAAIIFLAAYFGNKQQSDSPSPSLPVVKSDTGVIAARQQSPAATADTTNMTYRSQLSASR